MDNIKLVGNFTVMLRWTIQAASIPSMLMLLLDWINKPRHCSEDEDRKGKAKTLD